MQRNIRKWLSLKNWTWWRLYMKIKPMLSAVRAEEEMKKKVFYGYSFFDEIARVILQVALLITKETRIGEKISTYR